MSTPFKRIKELKKNDKTYNKNYEFNEDNKLIIHIELNNINEAYSHFSSKNDYRLNSELKDYIEKENIIGIHDLHFQINCPDLVNHLEEQDIFIKTIQTTFLDERHICYKKYRMCNLKSLLFFIFGFIVLSISIIGQLPSIDMPVIFSSIEILAWVFMWEAIDGFFLQRPEAFAKYIHKAKLTESTYEFVSNK